MTRDHDYIREAADRIASNHAITSRTVRGWLSAGVHPQVAEHFAATTDYGVDSYQLNMAVYQMLHGRPLGDLPDVTEEAVPWK